MAFKACCADFTILTICRCFFMKVYDQYITIQRFFHINTPILAENSKMTSKLNQTPFKLKPTYSEAQEVFDYF